MGSENNFALPLDLPSWNEGIKSLFAQPAMPPKDVAPAEESRPAHGKNMGSVRRVLAVNQGASAQAYHQKVIHDPQALHARGLATLPTANDAEFWLRKASGLAPKEAEAILMEALQRDVQPVTSIARALHELHKTLENSPAAPVAAGLHLAVPTQAVNDPLSFGGIPSSLTPGRTGLSGKAFRVPSRLANTPGAAKSHGAAAPQTKFHGILKKLQFSAATAAPEVNEEEEKEAADAVPPVPATTAAPAEFPATTTKRLQFESHTKHQSLETPASNTITVSTTAMTTGGLPGGFKTSMRKVTFGGNTVSPSHNPPRRSSMMVGSFHTPSAIAEGDSGDEDDEEEEASVGGGNGTVNSRNAGATPFDRRLSNLLTKYEDETAENAVDLETSAGAKTSPVNELWQRLSSISPADSIKALSSGKMCNDDEDENKSKGSNRDSSGNDSSLESMSLAGSTPVVLVEADDVATTGVVVEEKNAEEEISPNTAVASVLGVLLRRSLEDIEASKAAEATAAPRILPWTRDAVSPRIGILSTLPATAITPARSLTPMSIDGVVRDEEGIPIATPSSVTLFRGAAQAPRRNDDDDGFPVDLFRGFTTPPEVVISVTNRESNPAEPDFAFNLPGSIRNHQSAVTPASATTATATTPGGASDTASEGTPDLKLKITGGIGAKTGRHGPSPSLLQRFSSVTPSSARKAVDAPSLGKAQRVPTPSRSPVASEQETKEKPPPSLTREVRGLMQGISVTTPEVAPVALSPARASPMQQRELGVKTVVTPVRRSPRVAASSDNGKESQVTEMLEACGFAYVPNPALSTEKDDSGAVAGPSAGKKKKKALSTPKIDENDEITPPISRYGLRSASKATATKSQTGVNSRPGSAGDKALKLSPTEQNIRNTLRRSSRRERTTAATTSVSDDS